MKIIFSGLNNIFIGLHTAFSAMQYESLIWNPLEKPVYDMLDEQTPDIVFIDCSIVNDFICKALNSFKNNNNKIILFGDELPFQLNFDVWYSPNPGIGKKMLIPAADIVSLKPGVYNSKLTSDICYISTIDVEKSPEIMQYIELISITKYKFICCGHAKLPIHNYVGFINDDEAMNILKSTKINLDLNGYTLFYSALNQTFCISAVANPLFPSFQSLGTLIDLLNSFIPNEKTRRKIAKEAYISTMNKNTYFHRLIQIGKDIGYDWESQCLQLVEKFRS